MSYNAKTNWKFDDPVTEGDLNRIEAGIKDSSDKIGVLSGNGEVKEKANKEDLDGLSTTVTEHKADYQQHVNNESAHGIGDKSTLRTTEKSTIVSAINELFTFANNGKNDWANVIGSPLTTNDTFAQMRSKTQNQKNNLASNLIIKGQTANGNETLQQLINKVNNIELGWKQAFGTATAVYRSDRPVNPESINQNRNGNFIEVRGLDFAPKVVVALMRGTGTSRSSGIGISSTANFLDFPMGASLRGSNSNGTFIEDQWFNDFFEDGFIIQTNSLGVHSWMAFG